MLQLIFLAIAIAAFVAAYLIARPAWSSYRLRRSRDLNAERYLAWRGRATRGSQAPAREGMTRDERRRLWGASALGIIAIGAVVAFFVST